jgi:hypothetical protein
MKSGIIYNGPSLLDGKPIVVIATFSNRNTKTGAVVQTYILRSDINPLEASKTGEDFSICGDCTMRGEVTTDPARKQAKGRRCYVNLGQGVLIVFKSYLRGVYQPADPANRPLESRAAHVPSDRGPWRPRQKQRGPMSRIKRSRAARTMHSLQTLQGLKQRQINRDSRALKGGASAPFFFARQGPGACAADHGPIK